MDLLELQNNLANSLMFFAVESMTMQNKLQTLGRLVCVIMRKKNKSIEELRLPFVLSKIGIIYYFMIILS